MNKARQNHLTALVQDLPVVCASVYHQISNQQGGGFDRRVDAISHRIRWMTEASFQPQAQDIRRHCNHDGRHQSNARQHRSNDMLHHSNHRQHCSPPHGGCRSRVLTVGGRFPMMGERIGTGNPAGNTVNAATWDWIDGAPLHHLRRASTTYAGVLLDTDGSMKWRRQKKRA